MVFSTSPTAPLVVVHGSTGQQGGSVLRHLGYSSKPYRVRALMRNASRPEADQLRKQGVEVVEYTNGHGTAKVEEAHQAFKGADVVFVMSNVGPNEEEEGRTMVDAAKAAGVALFVFGGLPSIKLYSKGKYDCAAFDVKWNITTYARSVLPAVIDVQAPTYSGNFLNRTKARPIGNDVFAISFPIPPTATRFLLDTERDFGAYVVAAIEAPEDRRPQEVRAAADELTCEEICKVISRASGKNIVYREAEREDFIAKMPFPRTVAEHVADLLAASHEFGQYGGKAPTSEEELPLARKPLTFEQWAGEQDWSKVLT